MLQCIKDSYWNLPCFLCWFLLFLMCALKTWDSCFVDRCRLWLKLFCHGWGLSDLFIIDCLSCHFSKTEAEKYYILLTVLMVVTIFLKAVLLCEADPTADWYELNIFSFIVVLVDLFSTCYPLPLSIFMMWQLWVTHQDNGDYNIIMSVIRCWELTSLPT